ncbi:MAG TPA: branched-chain amino acid ABC transporter permease [Acidimicrobiales bacterium]|nr:branched-chain amino acid ABC transporter permease [Acidimicrobiales bacterium]
MTTATPIGQDEWARRSLERTEARNGLRRLVDTAAAKVPWHLRLLACLVLAALVPAVTSSSYILTVGVNTTLLAMLCLGLNVVVGWSGLLDLGYMAFYGLGAYFYSILSSDQLNVPAGIHLPTLASVPIAVVANGVIGLLVGLTSRRVADAYLAVVTLFFGEIFLEVVNNVAPLVTGGPNGIPNVDPFSLFGPSLTTVEEYYLFTLVACGALILLLRSLEGSRIGRAWRAVREDDLAAGFATIPVQRVKIYAFVFGAMVAGFAGCIFAAFETGTYPTDFGTSELFLMYAALILGGLGSIAGACIGAVVISVGLELLQSTTYSTGLFLGAIALTLLARIRPWRRLVALVAGLIGFGLALHAVVAALTTVGSAVGGTSALARAINAWLVVPASPGPAGNWAYVGMLAVIVTGVCYPRLRRLPLLVPALYLAAFVWETTLVPNPSTTSDLLLGGLLIVVMILRPRGLLGTMPKEVPT